MTKPARETVLLFYDGYEIKAREGRGAALFHALCSRARFAWGALRGKHNKSGFYVAFIGLCDALRAAGHDVRINDFRAARCRPVANQGSSSTSGWPTRTRTRSAMECAARIAAGVRFRRVHRDRGPALL